MVPEKYMYYSYLPLLHNDRQFQYLMLRLPGEKRPAGLERLTNSESPNNVRVHLRQTLSEVTITLHLREPEREQRTLRSSHRGDQPERSHTEQHLNLFYRLDSPYQLSRSGGDNMENIYTL